MPVTLPPWPGEVCHQAVFDRVEIERRPWRWEWSWSRGRRFRRRSRVRRWPEHRASSRSTPQPPVQDRRRAGCDSDARSSGFAPRSSPSVRISLLKALSLATTMRLLGMAPRKPTRALLTSCCPRAAKGSRAAIVPSAAARRGASFDHVGGAFEECRRSRPCLSRHLATPRKSRSPGPDMTALSSAWEALEAVSAYDMPWRKCRTPSK